MALLALECVAQKYAWGRAGLGSTVAQLLAAQGGAVDESQPYAELWMGTHASGPSAVVLGDGSRQALGAYLAAHPAAGATDPPRAAEIAAHGLPYLFKVLSVATALSIQAHPDKKAAERLHVARPKDYKDDNHKPEMACAVTEFEALAGFLPVRAVLEHVKHTPELAALLREERASAALLKEAAAPSGEAAQQTALKTLFATLMTAKPESVAREAAALDKRLRSAADKVRLIPEDALALRLLGQYPGDVGVFCAYFMVYKVLEPGQSVFLGANEPHAYLAGDCTEIMACSDNVVRAGLTPKLRDTDTLVSMLTYSQPGHKNAAYHPGNVLDGVVLDAHSRLYSPPDPAVSEFQMERTVLDNDKPYSVRVPAVGCILLVLSGEGLADGKTALKRGAVFFQPAGSKLMLKRTGPAPLVLFRASSKGSF